MATEARIRTTSGHGTLGTDRGSVGSGDRPAEASRMDLKAVREEAMEATTGPFWDGRGFAPDKEGEEWEEKYRRQFEQAKKRHATGAPIAVKPAPAAEPPPEQEPGWA